MLFWQRTSVCLDNLSHGVGGLQCLVGHLLILDCLREKSQALDLWGFWVVKV